MHAHGTHPAARVLVLRAVASTHCVQAAGLISPAGHAAPRPSASRLPASSPGELGVTIWLATKPAKG